MGDNYRAAVPHGGGISSPSADEEVHHDRFEDFVTTTPLAGLGTDLPLLRRMMATDPVTLDDPVRLAAMLRQSAELSTGEREYGNRVTCLPLARFLHQKDNSA